MHYLRLSTDYIALKRDIDRRWQTYKAFIMRTLTIIFLLLIANLTIAQPNIGWQILPSGTSNSLNSVYFLGADTGIIVGNNGYISKTTDGGFSWSSKNSGVTDPLNSVSFANSQIGFVVGGNSNFNSIPILKTIDGGDNWVPQTNPTHSLTNSVFAVNTDTAFIGGYLTLIKTMNGGATWVLGMNGIAGAGPLNFMSIFFIEQTGYAVGYNMSNSGPVIFKTTDNGLNWTQQITSSTVRLFSTYFLNNTLGFAVGENGSIIKTVDGGLNWVSQTSNTTNRLNSVFFTDSLTGYSVGNNGLILKTIDAGLIWSQQYSGIVNNLYEIYFPNQNIGYIVGDGGVILKTTSAGDSTNNIVENILDYDIKIYPNPSNGIFNIDLKNPKSLYFTITITDITGKTLFKTVCDKNIFKFDGNSLKSGIYFIKLNKGEGTIIKKFIKQ